MSGHIPAEEAAEMFWKEEKEPCEICHGRGWYSEGDHDPRCDGSCKYCPVEVQVQCPCDKNER